MFFAADHCTALYIVGVGKRSLLALGAGYVQSLRLPSLKWTLCGGTLDIILYLKVEQRLLGCLPPLFFASRFNLNVPILLQELIGSFCEHLLHLINCLLALEPEFLRSRFLVVLRLELCLFVVFLLEYQLHAAAQLLDALDSPLIELVVAEASDTPLLQL